MFVPHITRKSGIFTKGFIKLSSQFIFSREQSTFVISYISLLHLELFFEKKKVFHGRRYRHRQELLFRLPSSSLGLGFHGSSLFFLIKEAVLPPVQQ